MSSVARHLYVAADEVRPIGTGRPVQDRQIRARQATGLGPLDTGCRNMLSKEGGTQTRISSDRYARLEWWKDWRFQRGSRTPHSPPWMIDQPARHVLSLSLELICPRVCTCAANGESRKKLR
jgi:hypothetical protein